MNSLINILKKNTKKYAFREFVGLIFTILYSISIFFSTIVSKYLIDEVIPSKSYQKLIFGIFIFFIGCIGQPIFGYLKNRIFDGISEKITYDFRKDMFNKVVNAPIEFFDNINNGAVVSRISNDGRNISEFITNFFVVFIKNIFLISIILIGMLIMSPILTGIVIILFSAFFIINYQVSKKFTALSKKVQYSYDQICIKISHTVSTINTIKTFNQEHCVKEDFNKIIEQNYQNNMEYRKLNLVVDCLSNAFVISSLAIVYGVGSYLVIDNKITIGTIVAFGLFFQNLTQPVYEFLGNNIDIKKIEPILERINEYISLESEKKAYKNIISNITDLKIENLSFRYKDENNLALSNISMKLPDKGLIAIIGRSGSGKSTLIKLLTGLYNNYCGKIRLNNIDYKEYGTNEIREVISVVSQHIELMNGTIRDNITMGKTISSKELNIVLEYANINELINNLPNGIDTTISERVALSGGEMQRIAVARAIMKESRIYIFDEPTSALDEENERIIKNTIEELSKKALVIVITHNKTLLNKADNIYVMEEGKIINEGNYDNLTHKDLNYIEKITNIVESHM